MAPDPLSLEAERGPLPDLADPEDPLGRGLRPRVFAAELEPSPRPRELLLEPEPDLELEDFEAADDLPSADFVLAGDLPFAEDDLLAVERALLVVAMAYLSLISYAR